MHSSHHRAASRSLVGVGFVFVAAVLFAVNGTVSKLVMQSGLDSLHLVEIRCLAAAVVFFAIAAVRRRSSLRLPRSEWGFIALYGVIGVAMVQWLYFAAIARMPVSISLLIEFTAPLLVALWVRFVRTEEVRPRIWGALTLVLVGLALVSQVWSGLTLDGWGLALSGLAALALAAYYLLGERGLDSRDAVSLAAWSFAAAAGFWAIVVPWWSYPFTALLTTVPLGDGGAALPAWVLVSWVVLLGTVAPFGLVLAAITRIGPTRVGLIGTAEPPMAGAIAWLALGETLKPTQILGAAVVLGGILLAETARTAQPADDQVRAVSDASADSTNSRA